ncbi:MAG: 3-oxoacyl-ACP reductase FabG [Verrucomicrobia bacterium]|nr:3-oxoacyl-ACP reductase FabG [Verrucomicrobiota bacterium]
MSHRVILVTGANGGIGLAIARAFLEEQDGNDVWLAVRSRHEQARKLAEQFPNHARCVTLDVTQPDAWKAAVEEILAAHERLDVLVNNAGLHEDDLLANLSGESWRRVMATNLDAAFYGAQKVLPAMISQRHGRIINIASLSGLLAPAGQSNYAAAKAGLIAMTRSLAKEVARIGITVNSVCPGYIDGPTVEAMSDEKRIEAMSKIPMRRFGKPEEVAAAVLFLASPTSGYITGETLKIDGGIL